MAQDDRKQRVIKRLKRRLDRVRQWKASCELVHEHLRQTQLLEKLEEIYEDIVGDDPDIEAKEIVEDLTEELSELLAGEQSLRDIVREHGMRVVGFAIVNGFRGSLRRRENRILARLRRLGAKVE